jgi:hypothetical protein
VAPYLCSNSHVFNRPILEEYFFQVEGGLHLLQSCLCVVRDNFFPTTKKMHPSFMSLAITDALGLKASLRDMHHDAFFRFILENYSISLASKACIRFCSGKGSRLWLIVTPSICSFHVTHFTFILALVFVSV